MTSLSQRPLRSGSWAREARGASRASGDGDPWPRAFPRRSLSGTPHACRPDPVIKADGRAPCPAFSVTILGHEPSAIVPVAHVTSSLLGAALAASDSGSRGCRCSVVSFPSSRKPDRIYLLRFVNLAQIPSLCLSVSLSLSLSWTPTHCLEDEANSSSPSKAKSEYPSLSKALPGSLRQRCTRGG